MSPFHTHKNKKKKFIYEPSKDKLLTPPLIYSSKCRKRN